jgi:hypothetical protein
LLRWAAGRTVGGDHEPEYSTTDMLALQSNILTHYRHST